MQLGSTGWVEGPVGGPVWSVACANMAPTSSKKDIVHIFHLSTTQRAVVTESF